MRGHRRVLVGVHVRLVRWMLVVRMVGFRVASGVIVKRRVEGEIAVAHGGGGGVARGERPCYVRRRGGDLADEFPDERRW